jgi:hypothetical protein
LFSIRKLTISKFRAVGLARIIWVTPVLSAGEDFHWYPVEIKLRISIIVGKAVFIFRE